MGCSWIWSLIRGISLGSTVRPGGEGHGDSDGVDGVLGSSVGHDRGIRSHSDAAGEGERCEKTRCTSVAASSSSCSSTTRKRRAVSSHVISGPTRHIGEVMPAARHQCHAF